jgi:hypothetical protein
MKPTAGVQKGAQAHSDNSVSYTVYSMYSDSSSDDDKTQSIYRTQCAVTDTAVAADTTTSGRRYTTMVNTLQ